MATKNSNMDFKCVWARQNRVRKVHKADEKIRARESRQKQKAEKRVSETS